MSKFLKNRLFLGISISVIIVILLLIWLTGSFILLAKYNSFLYQQEKSHNVTTNIEYRQEFTEGQDGRLDMWFFENSSTPEVILYLHGNSGRIPSKFQFLANRYNVLSVAYPGFHTSEGRPKKENIYDAAIKAYDYLNQVKGFIEENIIIYGFSLGGSPALKVAKERPKAKKLILVGTYNSIGSMCWDKYLIFCTFSSRLFNNAELAKEITIPVRQYHLETDQKIPFAEGQKLFENFKNSDDKKFETLTFGVHYYYDFNQTLKE